MVVKFDDAVPLDYQAVALFDFERHLRKLTGLDCRVYKHLMGDDSKLRVMMSKDMRSKL